VPVHRVVKVRRGFVAQLLRWHTLLESEEERMAQRSWEEVRAGLKALGVTDGEIADLIAQEAAAHPERATPFPGPAKVR
jgi:hypothetical protein